MPQASAMTETNEVIAARATSGLTELAEQSEERSRKIHNNSPPSGTANKVDDQAASLDEGNTVSNRSTLSLGISNKQFTGSRNSS